MIVPDACVWIEALADTPTGRRYLPLLSAPQDLLVPSLVLFEVRRWALRELDTDAADRILAMQRQSRVLMLDEVISARGADLAAAHQLAAMDALIYATALQSEATLVTCDAHFKGLPGVKYRAKAAH